MSSGGNGRSKPDSKILGTSSSSTLHLLHFPTDFNTRRKILGVIRPVWRSVRRSTSAQVLPRRRCGAKMSSLDIVQSLQTKQLMLDLLTTSKLPKTLAAFSRQLEPVKIIHFFKCMESLCDYSTDDSDLFLAHLAVHPERTFSCSYCSKLIVSESSLVKHMVTVHGSCDFQCPLCFYRSCSKMHVIVHTLVVHRSRLVRWYLCKAVAPSAVEPISQVDLTTKFYRCVEGCSFHCLSPEVFVKHLSEKHSCYQQYTCHLCLGMVKSPNSLVQHYAAVHSFHFVQCLHCNFGRETAWDVLVHVAEEHADKPFKVLLRSSEAVEVFKRVQGLSKAPSHAAIPSPPVSCPAQPIATLNETVESASEYQQELPSPVLCGLGECTQTFPTAEVLLSHLTKDHPTELELSCPLCCQLRNVPWEDLCLHIVDAHTELARCPYKKCIFVSKTQQAIDDHIMHVHQSFESEEIEVHGLECNHEKSAYVVVGPRSRRWQDVELTANGGMIPRVKELRVLGLWLQEARGNGVMLDKLQRKVGAAMQMVRRVASRRRGMKEESVLRLVQAFGMSHIAYVAGYLKWGVTEKGKINALIRRIYKAAIGLLACTSTEMMERLGVHNTLEEVIEAQRISQTERLRGSAVGRRVLSRVGVGAEAGRGGLERIKDEDMRRLRVRPVPRHMHPERDKGRRQARAQALYRLYGKEEGSVYVDGAFDGDRGVAVVVAGKDGRVVTASGLRCDSAEEVEEVAVAMAISIEGAATILCDGTFKTVPRQFYQLYTLYGVKEFQGRNIFFPFAFSLLSSKTEDAYLHLFNALLLTCQRHGFVLSPGFIITDFEIAAINALRQVFQASVLHGCFFHLSHNVYRQVQKTGLQAQYANDAAFSSLADKLLEWFEKHYVMGRARTLQNGLVIRAPPLFPPSLWSVQPLMDLGQPRGNNSVEGWHSRFLKLVAGAHPGFWKFLTCIAAEHQLTEDKLEAMLRSQEPPRQKKAIAARNEKREAPGVKGLKKDATTSADGEPRQYLREKTAAIACCVVCGGRSGIPARGSGSQGTQEERHDVS
ncbi:zinc finger protein Xfin [Ixodes scapularis]